MALLITQDQYLIALNNSQHCKSVLRGRGRPFHYWVTTKYFMPFFPPEFHTDLAWKLKVIKASKQLGSRG